MKTMKPIVKYLERYAEPAPFQLHEFLNGNIFDHFVAVPLYGESPETVEPLLQSIVEAARYPTLVALVINAHNRSTPETFKLNEEMICHLSRIYPHQIEGSVIRLTISSSVRGIVLNHSQPNSLFSEKDGVGRARKIGCDLGLRLWSMGALRSPYLLTTDADVQVPPNYFDSVRRVSEESRAAGIIFNFTHCAQPLQSDFEKEALQLYDRYLHYYRDGLKWAESPYAFHSVGSLIAVHALSYAKVRGFPKRMAGEDFYLLNKLKKIGDIQFLDRVNVRLSGRISERVPFGTGQSVRAWAERLQRREPILISSPEVFQYLSIFLKNLRQVATERSTSPLTQLPEALKQWIEESELLAQSTRFLKQSPDKATLSKSLMDWFDGFQTLRLIHFLRDRHNLRMEAPLAFEELANRMRNKNAA